MSFGAQFLAGQKFAQGLIETYRDAQQRRELDEISKAQPVSADFLSDDASAKVQAAAADPTQQIGYDTGAKAYMATPKLGVDEMGPAQPKQIATAEPMTELLGKRTPGTMTPDQVSNAKFKAMADVVGKSDPIQGMRLQREVKQGERDDKRWEREDATATKAENDKAFAEKLDGQVGEWFKGRLKNPDGTERAPTVDDHLAASQYRAAQLTSAGKIDQAGQVLKDYAAQSLVKIQLQGAQRKEALGRTAAALASGDLDAVKDFYNEFVPDGARVTDVKRGAGGELVIQRESLDGRALPAYTMKDTGQLLSVLNSFNDPMALYSWSQNEFKNNIDARKTAVAERQADIAERRLGALEARAYGGGSGGGQGGAKDGGGPAVWDDKADAYLRDRYTTKDPSTGEVRVDGSGLQFGKTLALAVSQNNGGDHTKGLGYAFQKDNELRVAATDKTGKYDAAKHEQLRQQYLMAISGQQATSPAPAATTGAQQNSGQRPAQASEGRGAIGNPMPSQILTTMGGILPRAGTYTPPPDSPAGKAQASREAARTATMKQEAERAKAVADAAAAAISSKDPAAAQAVQSMPGFGALPLEQKAEIRRIVFGR